MEAILDEPLQPTNSPTQDIPVITVAEDPTQFLESPSVCFTASDTTLSPRSERGFKDSTRRSKFSARSSKDSLTRRSKFSARSFSKKSGRRNSAKPSSFKWSDVVHAAIQAAGLITAVVFGVWAVRTYDVARNSLVKADTANVLTRGGLNISSHGNDISLLALDAAINANNLTERSLKIASDANRQARLYADAMIAQTMKSHEIALAANYQALMVANITHNLTKRALAIAHTANILAVEIANTTNDLTRTSHAIAIASNHQTLAQNRLGNWLQLLSICGTAKLPRANLVSIYLPHAVRSGSTLYMCLFYMLRRQSQTDHCASITPRLWAFVTSSVVPPPTSTQNTTSSGTTQPSSDRILMHNATDNPSTSMSLTLARTTTLMRSSASTSPTTMRPSVSTSPTKMRPSASASPTTMRPSVSTSPTPPPTRVRPSPILASQKTMELPVIIGIVVAVVVFFVAVGALIAYKEGSITRLG